MHGNICNISLLQKMNKMKNKKRKEKERMNE